jgi:hypothetical protein
MANGRPGPSRSVKPCTSIRHEPTPQQYRSGCCCPATQEAWSQYQQKMRERRKLPDYIPPAPRKPAKPTPLPGEIRMRNLSLALGAQRRIQAMIRIGHTVGSIACHSGLSSRYIYTLSGGSYRGGVTPRSAGLINDVYQKFQYIRGKNRHAASWGQKKGYLPPAAWAPDDLDNPEARPTWPYRTGQHTGQVSLKGNNGMAEHDATHTAALAAIMARLNRHLGQRVTFPTPDGGKVTGTLSEYELTESVGGSVWVRFRELADLFQVTGFPEETQELSGQVRQVEKGSTQE